MLAQPTVHAENQAGHPDLLLEVKGLQTHFFLEEGVVKAVDGVDFQLERGKTLAIVGESGCGKSVMARTILQIVPNPGRIVGGEILFHRQHPAKDGRSTTAEVLNITAMNSNSPEMRDFRGKEASMIFQEPMTSLSPVHTIGNQIMENFLLHFPVSKEEARKVAIGMLEKVGIPKAAERIDAYPHLVAENPTKEYTLTPVWNTQDWGSPDINKVVVQPALNQFIAKCKKRNIKVG